LDNGNGCLKNDFQAEDFMDLQKIDLRRIGIFLAFAYGIAWATALVIYLTGGLANSPFVGGTQIRLALILEATVYMAAPALAHVLTRLVTKEGWKGLYLRPKFRGNRRYWAAGYFGPGILTILGGVFFFLLFPIFFDPALAEFNALMAASVAQTGRPMPPISPWMLIGLQTVQVLLLSPVINSLFTFGEEFGWRAYLQPKLMPLGGRNAMLAMGLIWGVWHWPLIAMGHNYGLDYSGYPWLGMLVMVWFTMLLGIFIGWASLRGGSVWPAVIGHAAINGIAGLATFLTKDEPSILLGPAPIGIIGSAGFLAVCLWIFLAPGQLDLPVDLPAVTTGDVPPPPSSLAPEAL
jgi:membrane protease YdiL (CAAX protease family)